MQLRKLLRICFCSFFVVTVLLRGPSYAGATERAERLEQLKREFPAHIAGPVTDTTDPLIRKCYFKYRDQVGRLTMSNLPEVLGKIRETLDVDISVPGQWQTGKNVRHASSMYAERQNLAWLKSKLLPYVQRLEQFQRGK